MKKISSLILAAAVATTALIGSGCASTSTTASAPEAQPAPVAAQTTTQPANTTVANGTVPLTYQWSNSNATVTAVQNATVMTSAQTPGSATKPTLKFVKVDSEETAGENGAGANAVDGDPATFWHTQWQDASPPCPHEIIIELNPPSTIKGFTYLPRQDDSENGTIKDYEFYTSDDGVDFGQPVSKGTFENGKNLKTITFDAKKCRFIKLKALSEINDADWTSAAEIGIVPAK